MDPRVASPCLRRRLIASASCAHSGWQDLVSASDPAPGPYRGSRIESPVLVGRSTRALWPATSTWSEAMASRVGRVSPLPRAVALASVLLALLLAPATATTCFDGVQNSGETDVDCGGSTTCPRCYMGEKCLTGSDCYENSCSVRPPCRPVTTPAVMRAVF